MYSKAGLRTSSVYEMMIMMRRTACTCVTMDVTYMVNDKYWRILEIKLQNKPKNRYSRNSLESVRLRIDFPRLVPKSYQGTNGNPKNEQQRHQHNCEGEGGENPSHS